MMSQEQEDTHMPGENVGKSGTGDNNGKDGKGEGREGYICARGGGGYARTNLREWRFVGVFSL